ncbi:MAG: hypothetical protein Q9171_000369 [Xanthocarpia ochracea]
MPPHGRRRLSSLAVAFSLFCLFVSTASAASAVLGIDLGTEYIKTALVKPGIPLEIVLTKDSKRKETAAVAFKPSKSSSEPNVFPERIYGGDALALSARFPRDVYSNLKPLLAQQYQKNDLVGTYQERFPELGILEYTSRGTVGFSSSSFPWMEDPFSVEELLAMELKNIRANAAAMAGKGSTIKDAVITIPPFFTAEEKRAVVLAADLAGLRVLSLISDGLAVGLNYATSRSFPTVNEGGKPEIHLIFDMGAGSTSATILKFQGKTVKDIGKFNKTVQEVQVLGAGWDKSLGGDALNQVIVDDMVAKFASTDRMQALGSEAKQFTQHGRTMAKLWKESERLRQVLSANTETQASFEGLYLDDVNFKYKITRAQFEKLSLQYATKVKSPITLALESAKLSLSDLESVILHGGAVRTPFVQKELEAIVGSAEKIRTNVNSDEAAVFGAAFKAATLSPSFRVKEIRTGDTPGYASGATWIADGKERQQKLFAPTSTIGAEKQVAFKLLEDFTFFLYQQTPAQAGEFIDKPIVHIQTKNLSASVKQLEDSFGCVAADMSTKFAIRLSPIDGLPEVVRGSVSCEATEKKGGVVDGMKDLFGFGSKKEDQKPLADDVEDLDTSSLSSGSETTSSTSSPKESATPDPASSDNRVDDKTKEAKKKTQIIYVDFTSEATGLPQLSEETLKRIKERLDAFDASDRSRVRREETLNRLEGFTYKARDLLEDEGFIAASTDILRKEIEQKFKDASDWLYGDGADASRDTLKERLDELRGLVEPVQKREEEAAKRPNALKSLQEALDQVKVMVDVVKQQQEAQSVAAEQTSSSASSASLAADSASSAAESSTISVDDFADLDDDTYSTSSTTSSTTSTPTAPSYSPADLASLISTRDDVQSWLDSKLAAQEKLSPIDDPVILASDLEAKSRELNKVVMDLLQRQMKKAPKTPPPPPKKEKGGKKVKGGAKGGKGKLPKSIDIEELWKDMPASEREELEKAMKGIKTEGSVEEEEADKPEAKEKEKEKEKEKLVHEELQRKHLQPLHKESPAMSPAKRHSLHLDLPTIPNEGLPQIAALFLIRFDAKAGYVATAFSEGLQSRHVENCAIVDITDSVEYKSLPSGLHDVQEDTIYFVHHDEYAGISSYVKAETEAVERNALMLAVGVLIPLSYGRLGKSWRKLVKDSTKTELLDDLWQEHQAQEGENATGPTSGEASPSALKEKRRRAKSSPNGQPHTRNRAVSSASALAPPGQTLSARHPALSLSTYLDTFGPLVFPIYKASLLRKRVLLLGHAPVELACNFAYNISILSTLPAALHTLLPLSPLPTRLRPLFSVGVHDIPTLTTGSRDSAPQESLATEGQAYGWVACTTDHILGTKDHLYDTLVTLPSLSSTDHENQTNKVWPRVQGRRAMNIRATQRDARRYRVLRQDLAHYHSSSSRPPSSQQPAAERYTDDPNPNNDTAPLLPMPSLSRIPIDPNPPPPEPDQNDILESQSWSALAYNSFMWWASAGETRTDREEEAEYDSSLLANLDPCEGETPSPGMSRGRRGSGSPFEGEGRVVFEMALIGYFHRLTVLILRTLSDVVDAAANERDDGGSGSVDGRFGDGRGEDAAAADGVVVVEVDDMTRMGLDIWSESDRVFVEELVEFYWGRKAIVRGGRVECCGVRVI